MLGLTSKEAAKGMRSLGEKGPGGGACCPLILSR